MCISAVPTPANSATATRTPAPQPHAMSLENCRHWLDTAYMSTEDNEIRTMIEDLDNDLLELGAIDPTMNEIVLGALESVASAITVSEAHAAARVMNPPHLSLR